MNKIPVFLHIPKNAGTYVLSVITSIFRFYLRDKSPINKPVQNLDLRKFHILDSNNKQCMKLIVWDFNNLRKSLNEISPDLKHNFVDNINITDLDPVLNEIKNGNLFLFSVFIEPRGVKLIKQGVFENIFDKINKIPIYFTIFRHPYDRVLSLYNYIKSGASKHEATHQSIRFETFEEYISSNEIEESWLIRNLCDLPPFRPIIENDFEVACSILKKFQIENISNTDKIIDSVFTECYDCTRSIIKEGTVLDKNATVYSENLKLELSSLSKEAMDKFLERIMFDRRLYRLFTLKN
jgi:hypothetical protein